MTLTARERGFKRIFLPAPNAAEAAVAQGIDVMPVGYFDELIHYLHGTANMEPAVGVLPEGAFTNAIDMADVKGQEWVKEALVIAAAGGHNILLVGPPGSGKTVTWGGGLVAILPVVTMVDQQHTRTHFSSSHGSGLFKLQS